MLALGAVASIEKTLELTQFVDSHEIDPIYFDKPYYVVPADDLAEEAFVVLREALKRSHKIGLGQLAMRGREYVVSIKGCGRGMVMETLRYAAEVHKAARCVREIGATTGAKVDIDDDGELLPRDRRHQAGRRSARPRADADRQEDRRV